MTAVTVITMSRDELANIISEAVQSGIERATQKTGERWGVADLARHYRVCEATIRNRRKAGMLPQPELVPLLGNLGNYHSLSSAKFSDGKTLSTP